MSDISARLMKVGRTHVVIGLHWVALNADSRRADRKAVVEAAKESGSRFAAYYGNEGTSFRLAGVLPGISPTSCKGKASAAAWLAESVDKETIYIEQLSDGSSWIVDASPQSITLRSDRILSAEAAGELLDDLLSDLLGGGNAEFDLILGSDGAPPSTVLGTAQEFVQKRSFEELVVGSASKGAVVKQVVGVPPTLIFAIAGVVLLVLIGLAYSWWQKKSEQELLAAELQAVQAAQQAQQQGQDAARQLQMQQALTDALIADTATPDPDRLIRTCISAAEILTRSLGGWAQQNIRCDFRAGVVIAQYSRKAGSGGAGASRFATNESLQQASERVGAPAVVQVAGEIATVALSILDAVPRTALTRPQLPLAGEAVNAVPSRLQWGEGALPGFAAEIGDLGPRQILIGGAAASPNQPLPPIPAEYSYQRGVVRVSGSRLWTLTAVSYAWPFVSIDKAVLIPQPKTGYAWSLEGTYVARGEG